jgi:hypothetical protein
MAFHDKQNLRRKEGALEDKNPGPYLARVISNIDADYNGTIRVQLLHEGSGNEPVPGQLTTAKYMTPYWSTTDVKHNGNDNTFASTQKANGMWIPAPDVGSQVIVMLIEGNIKNAYWMGVVPDRYKNFTVPGAPATTFNPIDPNKRLPVGELNKNTNSDPGKDETAIIKPVHDISKVFETQGLLKDDIRGITSSGARRETPSKVFGINTSGPIDATSPMKNIGTPNEQIMAYVNKLGGSSFVMDDGDTKYRRTSKASDGPPEYVATGGQPNIPHNELVRIRTRTGHQILLHNSEDLIYIGNAKGTTWIELTSNGKIDIFAEDSISIHTKNDLNIRADRDLNLEAGRNVNIKAAIKFHAETGTGNLELQSGVDTLITSKKISHINSAVKHVETAAKIYMNDPGNIALTAIKLPTYFNPTEVEGKTVESILLRVPTHEPWPLHENLNPADFVPSKTDIKIGTAASAPGKWTLYTTPTDTFKQNKG